MPKMRKYIDIGANLTDLMFSGIYNGSKKHDADLAAVLKRSWDAGVDKIIITGGNWEESEKAIEIATKDCRLYTTVGCHPTRCSEFEAEGDRPENYLNRLYQLIREHQNKVVAVGECGLDYDRTGFCPIEVQKKYFEMQLKLAETTELPLFLHCRNAAADLLTILRKFPGNLQGGVVHSFDGTLQEAKSFIDLGFYIGINGCSLKTLANLKTVEKLPSDKILIETDSPWCEIRPTHAGYSLQHREHMHESVKKEKWKVSAMVKGRNEPANIALVLDVISELRQDDGDQLAAQIYQNTMDLFFSK